MALSRHARVRTRTVSRRVWQTVPVMSAAALLAVTLIGLSSASAATGLTVSVGYMDTHTVGSSSKQPSPWPYQDSSSFVGSPCANYPNSTTCWDASAVRLDNTSGTDITGVHVVVLVGATTYNLWGSNLTVKANSLLVLTETGSQNSGNFDGSDEPPNAYNAGNTASCVNSGAIPVVRVTVGGTTTDYSDTGQVLNGGGVDSGHCLGGTFVSSRMDESHPWVQIGSGAAPPPSAPTAPSAPQGLTATAGDGSVALSWTAPASDGGAAITGYNVYRGTAAGGEAATPVASNVATTSFTDTGLANGSTYYYKVAAVNAVGTSPKSNEASATPQSAATAPSAPRALTATAGNGSVALSWSVPASDGGAAITGYNVYRGNSAGGEAATPIASNVAATGFTDFGITSGVTYYYTVAAVNGVGTSPASNEAVATLAPAAAPSPSSAGGGTFAAPTGAVVTAGTPNPGVCNVVSSVAALSASNVWAVGSYRPSCSRASRTLVMHYNGRAWTTVFSPNRGSFGSSLSSVVALSPTNVWAVGSSDATGHGRFWTLVEHWNGRSWAIVPSPNPGTGWSVLRSVAAVSAGNLWAVGSWSSSSGRTGGALIEHWNGRAWRVVAAPANRTFNLFGVSALAWNNVWATGTRSGSGRVQTLAVHWNGRAWTAVATPNAGAGNNWLLGGVKAFSWANVWSVGWRAYGSGFRPLTLHYNGARWSVVPAVWRTDAYFYGVGGSSGSDVWAVGRTGGSTLIEHWNGARWGVVASPSPGTRVNELTAVTSLSRALAFAVGYRSNTSPLTSSYAPKTLVERWGGAAWRVM